MRLAKVEMKKPKLNSLITIKRLQQNHRSLRCQIIRYSLVLTTKIQLSGVKNLFP